MRIAIILSALLVFSACSKENSKKWLLADLTIMGATDGSAVPSTVELEYTVVTLLGSYVEKKQLGSTGDDGKMNIELEVRKKNQNYKLNIYPGKSGYYIPGSQSPARVIPLSHPGKNIEVVSLPKGYLFRPSVKNINCYNEQDSMWLNSFPNEYAYTGCTDIDLSNAPGYPAWSEEPVINYDIRVKRNGVTTEFQKSFALERDIVNHFVIEY